MSWIKVRCRTNLDNYHKEQWPTEMCCRPIQGDTVASKTGKVLKVVQVRHALDRSEIPYLEVELHN